MQNLLIKDHINQENLLPGLSSFFGKMNLSVAYLDTSIIQTEDVLLESSPLEGDVRLDLCIYSKHTFDVDELSIFICSHFATSVLISDNDINPYSWILVTKDGRSGTVYNVPEATGVFKLSISSH